MNFLRYVETDLANEVFSFLFNFFALKRGGSLHLLSVGIWIFFYSIMKNKFRESFELKFYSIPTLRPSLFWPGLRFLQTFWISIRDRIIIIICIKRFIRETLRCKSTIQNVWWKSHCTNIFTTKINFHLHNLDPEKIWGFWRIFGSFRRRFSFIRRDF